MQSVWWRRALQQRLGTLAAAALLLWTAGIAVAATLATRRIADTVRVERHAQAVGIARRIEQALGDALRQLDLVAAASALPDPADLAAHVRGMRLAESVVRVGPEGDILWARSVVNGGETAPGVGRLSRPDDGRWHAEASRLVDTTRGPRVFLLLPARESDALGGAVAAAIDPETSSLHALVASYAGQPYRVELRDETGREIVASRPAGAAGLAPPDSELLIARAPVSNGRWEVRLVQPQDEALAPVIALRRILVGSSLLLLPFAVLVALATARSIRLPVLAMTRAAERLARGVYEEPVPAAGEDEIGRLALALEQLRRALEGDERRSLLLKRVISAQEEERRRIARELHDQTAQQLTALSMRLESAAAAHPDAAARLAASQALVHAMIDDLHRLIHDLRPSMLDDLGLLPAIRSYAASLMGARGISVHCEFPDALPELSREAAIALYRVVQEALTNVVRHAGAETVLIACTVTDGELVFEVEDDGAGFEPAALARPRETGEGLGLLGMRERLALLGGRLAVHSEPGGGTRVVAVLPLDTPSRSRRS